MAENRPHIKRRAMILFYIINAKLDRQISVALSGMLKNSSVTKSVDNSGTISYIKSQRLRTLISSDILEARKFKCPKSFVVRNI